MGAAEQFRLGDAESAGAIAHLGQHVHRHTEDAAHALVPLAAFDIEQHGARGIGRVGRMHLAAGEPPQQETVDGAEGELAWLGFGARAFDMVEQPGDLAGGKIRIEQQPGLGGDSGFVAAFAQRVASIRGAPVLPDDGVMDRLAGGAIPDHHRFALIGDADAGDIFRREARLRHRLAHDGDRGLPDFLRIVLDPARRRINLGEFALRGGERLKPGIEHDRARRCRALIDGDDMRRQNGPRSSRRLALRNATA